MTLSISFGPPLTTAEQSVLQSIMTSLGAGAATATPSATPATNYFPADPGTAPFPSPENSTSLWLNGAVSGSAYLRDMNGTVYQIKPAAPGWTLGAPLVNGAPDNGARLYVNGTMICGGYPAASMIVRQGMIYLTIASGQTQNFNPGTGSTYNTALPAAWASGTSTAATSGTAGTAGLPPLPATLAPATVAPGSSGKTLTVPPGTAIQSVVSNAQPGDTVIVSPGTYTAGATWSVPLKLVLTGVVLDLAGQTAGLPHGLGALAPFADTIIQDGEIKNVAMDQGTSQLTSAIRPGAPCHLTVNNTSMHDNQCGIGQGGFDCVITLNGANLVNNGLGDGYSHNIYTNCSMLTLNNVTSINPNGGHAVKQRGQQLIVTGGTFSATDATIFDLPAGTTTPFLLSGTTMTKPAGSANHGIISYGLEGQTNGMAGGSVTGGTINALCDSPLIQSARGTITVTGVSFAGNKVTSQGGTVTGL